MTTKPKEKYIEEFIQGIAEIVQKKIESGKATFFVSKDEPHQEPSAEDQLYELKADISNGVGFLFVDALQKKGELYKLIKKLRQSTIDDVVEKVGEIAFYHETKIKNDARDDIIDVIKSLQSQTTVQEEKEGRTVIKEHCENCFVYEDGFGSCNLEDCECHSKVA